MEEDGLNPGKEYEREKKREGEERERGKRERGGRERGGGERVKRIDNIERGMYNV